MVLARTDPARPAYTVKTRVDSLEADEVLSAWTPVRGLLHGSLATTLNLSGAGFTPDDLKGTLTAVGLAAVANGALGPGPVLEAVARYTRVPALRQLRFKDGRLPFRIERGRVVTDPVVFDGPHGEWRVTGSVGFDGTLDYAVSATLPPEVVERLGAASALAAGALSDPQGRLLLDLRLTGKAVGTLKVMVVRGVTRNNEQFWSDCNGKDPSYAGMRPIGESIRLKLFIKSYSHKIVAWPDRLSSLTILSAPPAKALHEDILSKKLSQNGSNVVDRHSGMFPA